MDDPAQPSTPGPTKPGPAQRGHAGLRGKALGGMIWALMQTLGAKVVTIVGQIALGFYLVDSEWGIFGAAWSVAALGMVFQTSGLSQVLVYRDQRRWENPALWMAVTIGMASAAVLASLAPLIARLMKEPDLPPVLWSLCPYLLFSAIFVVPQAKAKRELRFKLIAVDKFFMSFGVTGLQVLFAVMNHYEVLQLGAMAFSLPFSIIMLFRLVEMCLFTKPRFRLKPQAKRWKYLMGEMSMLLFGRGARQFIRQGGPLVLGLFHPLAIVGVYYFAYRLSFQTVNVFATNLSQVLHPVLAKLKDDPARQVQSYMKVERMLAMIGVPMTIMLAVAADPLIRVVYAGGRWDAAIPVLQVLSIGMGFRLMMNASEALLLAMGRFKAVTGLSLAYAALWSVMTITAAALTASDAKDLVPNVVEGAEQRLSDAWPAVVVGMAIAGSMILFAPIQIYIAVREHGGRWRDVFGVFAVPYLLSVITFGGAFLLAQLIEATDRPAYAAQLAVVIFPGLLTYLLLCRLVRPAEFRSATELITKKLRRRKPKPATPNAEPQTLNPEP